MALDIDISLAASSKARFLTKHIPRTSKVLDLDTHSPSMYACSMNSDEFCSYSIRQRFISRRPRSLLVLTFGNFEGAPAPSETVLLIAIGAMMGRLERI